MSNTDDSSVVFVERERDLFKKQFLKIQANYETKIKEFSILKELGDTLRSADFYDTRILFGEQIKIVRRYTGLEKITLMLYNDRQNALEIMARSDADMVYGDGRFVDPHTGILARVMTQKEPVLIGDVTQDTLSVAELSLAGQALLCLPILHNQNVIGLLCLGHSLKNGFDHNHVRFFSLVTDQIATAVILSRLYNQMLREEHQRFLLSRFFSKTVTDKILDSHENLRLGGERKQVTIIFADLHGFTSISETLAQEKVVEILNAYFSRMTPIIFQYNGTLDKLMGDGMLAIFGAPISYPDDCRRALQAVLDMTRALADFNRQNRELGWPELSVSIGINLGDVVAGYIGSEDHMNYTVIGDAVNVAQRLQSLAGPGEILVSDSVREKIRNDPETIQGLKELIPLPLQKLKGREQPLAVYRLMY